MRQICGMFTALAVTLCPVAASAQQGSAERGPGKFLTGGTAVPLRQGVGAEVRLTIALTGERSRPADRRMHFDVNAGPTLLLGDGRIGRDALRTQSSLINLRLTPGHSTGVTLAGQPVAVHYGPLASDEERGEGEKKKGGGPSTAGWVAIGVGATVVAVVGGLYVALVTNGPTD